MYEIKYISCACVITIRAQKVASGIIIYTNTTEIKEFFKTLIRSKYKCHKSLLFFS